MNFLSLILAGASFGAPQGTLIKLEPLPEGASRAIGYYMPMRVQLSSDKPASVKAVPADFTAVRYGSLTIGGQTIALALDEPEGKPARLVVDANGDGDLSNDPLADWKPQGRPGPDGKTLTMYFGTMHAAIPLAGSKQSVTLSAYRFDPTDASRPQLKDTLLYYRDFAVKGTMRVGRKSYPIILSDETGSGNFTPVKGGQRSGVTLLIDRDGDGKFTAPAEQYDASKPFTIDGKTFELADVSGDGASFRLVPSKEVVAEIPLPPNTSLGKTVLAFDAETTRGQKINFPKTYKGKVVMLDFWATWCGPCVAELPNVKKAYSQFHDKGFEILSISLDNAGDGPKLEKFTKDNDMPWSQVFDGGGWGARVAKLYGVNAIPFVLLVDGDTGKIIGNETTLRGPQISNTIEKALKDKGLIK